MTIFIYTSSQWGLCPHKGICGSNKTWALVSTWPVKGSKQQDYYETLHVKYSKHALKHDLDVQGHENQVERPKGILTVRSVCNAHLSFKHSLNNAVVNWSMILHCYHIILMVIFQVNCCFVGFRHITVCLLMLDDLSKPGWPMSWGFAVLSQISENPRSQTRKGLDLHKWHHRLRASYWNEAAVTSP